MKHVFAFRRAVVLTPHWLAPASLIASGHDTAFDCLCFYVATLKDELDGKLEDTQVHCECACAFECTSLRVCLLVLGCVCVCTVRARSRRVLQVQALVNLSLSSRCCDLRKRSVGN